MASQPGKGDVSFLEGWLSDRALRTLAAMGARRDPELMCDRRELVRGLRARSRPVSPAILDFEETVGGLVYGRRALGVCAALRAGRAPSRDSYKGAPLAPIHLAGEGGGDDELYMDEEGRIYQTDAMALGGVLADSWQVFLEREALAHAARERFGLQASLEINALVGEPLSRHLGAELLPEASDSRRRIWHAPEVELSELEELVDFWPAGTYVVSGNLDRIVEALRWLQAEHPTAAVRFTPARKAPQAKPTGTPILRVPRLDAHSGDVVGELVVYGSPGRYAFMER